MHFIDDAEVPIQNLLFFSSIFMARIELLEGLE